MRLGIAIPEHHVDKPVLDAALEATTRLNESLLDKGAPTFKQAANRVRWQPEPPGQEHFDNVKEVLGRGWGDCDDLAPWHAASLRVTGEDPGARAIVKRSGPKTWHAIVQRSNGMIEDPSLYAGMPNPRNLPHGIHGATLEPMTQSVVGTFDITRPSLALRPVRDRQGQIEAWQARADLPWHWRSVQPSPVDVAMASLHTTPSSSQAIVGACLHGCQLAHASGMFSQYDVDRAAAIANAARGVPWEDLAEVYGPDHADAAGQVIGSFFGSLLNTAKKAVSTALPIANTVLPFVPGVGPVAQMALRAATPTLQKMLKGGHHVAPGPARMAAQAAFRGAAPAYAPHYGHPRHHGGHGGGFNLSMHCVPA